MHLTALADYSAPEPDQLMRARGRQWVVARTSTTSQPADELAAPVPGRSRRARIELLDLLLDKSHPRAGLLS